VKITKGADVFEKEIEVQYDPKSPFTLEERTAQQKTTLELYNFNQELAYFVYELDQWDASVKGFLNENSAPNKAAQALSKELDNLRDKMVITKGDNYVGAGEPRLREKLGDIYSTIGSYYGAPSSTQLENIAMLRNTFNEGKAQFEKMKTSTIKAFEKELVKKSKTSPKILSFEEFLKSEN
jgi:hypothetical protein